MIIRIDIKEQSEPKDRPRFGRYGNVHTTNKTRRWENTIRKAADLEMKRLGASPYPLEERLGVVLVIYRNSNENGSIADADNLMKAVLDGLNKLVYTDDKQVRGSFKRIFDNYPLQPKVSVFVMPIAQFDSFFEEVYHELRTLPEGIEGDRGE